VANFTLLISATGIFIRFFDRIRLRRLKTASLLGPIYEHPRGGEVRVQLPSTLRGRIDEQRQSLPTLAPISPLWCPHPERLRQNSP
jgi:hypothetical protein